MFSEGYGKELFNWGIWILDLHCRMCLHLDKVSELEMLKRRILEIALAAALLEDMGQVDSWQYAHHKIVASSGYFFQVISDSIKKCFNFVILKPNFVRLLKIKLTFK